MFISTQFSCPSVQLLTKKPLAELTGIDLEWLLTKTNNRNVEIVDGETREQILQSVVMRMRQVRYLRRLPVSTIRTTSRY